MSPKTVPPIHQRGYVHPEVLVSTDWVAEHLNDPAVRIIESNEDPLLYPSGHIPGAVNIGAKALFTAENLATLPTDKQIVTYCYTGQTSAQIACYLQMLGYNAKSLMFGQNGFGYTTLTKSKYTVPTTDYSAIIVK